MVSVNFKQELLTERPSGAFLGLALGDAYGRPLEFARSEDVRTRPVSTEPGKFKWTDDTHMAIYLAKAVLDVSGKPFDEEAFGTAVGRRFVEWLHDPLTPTTAPGATCIRGAQKFETCSDWHRSGDSGSDGCGAVMRIAPLAMAFRDDTLTTAARISAVVTHAYPNAVAAAVAGSLLLRLVIERGLSPAAVQEVIRFLQSDVPESSVVAAALAAALNEAQSTSRWLNEAAIPEGDGGWRSPSALGLAVTSALRFPHDFARAVEFAARIDGDSDSVAALAGMYVGAGLGKHALPDAWLAALPQSDLIEELAGRLAGLSETMSSANYERDVPGQSAVRTSLSSPIGVNWLAGLDGCLGPGHGRVGLTLAPGKKGPSLYGWDWCRDLEMDLARLRETHRAELLVCLLEDREMTELSIPALLRAAEDHGMRVVHEAIPDLHAPTMDQAFRLADLILQEAKAGHNVVIHCRGGLGRAGTVAACCYVQMGRTAEDAINQVRSERPGAIETPEQATFISTFASNLAAQRTIGTR